MSGDGLCCEGLLIPVFVSGFWCSFSFPFFKFHFSNPNIHRKDTVSRVAYHFFIFQTKTIAIDGNGMSILPVGHFGQRKNKNRHADVRLQFVFVTFVFAVCFSFVFSFSCDHCDHCRVFRVFDWGRCACRIRVRPHNIHIHKTRGWECLCLR